MARITGSSSKNGYGFFVDVWDTEVTDGATNTSKVGFNLYIQNNDHRFNGSNYVIDMTINGTNYGTTKTINTTTVGYSDACLILSGTSNAIAHNSDGTKSVFISASVSRSSYSSYDGGYMSLSGTFTLQKINRYFSQTPVLTYTSATETTMNFSWSTSEACSKAILYRDGAAIQTKSSLNATSGTFDTVTGLSANTQYNFYVLCTRKDSGIDSSSIAQNRTTYAYPSIKSIGTSTITLPAPGTNISQSIVLNNPLNRTNVTVYAKKDNTSGTLFGSVANSSSALTNLTLTLTTNTMYSSIPSATNGSVVYYCVYNDGSNNHTSATVAGTFVTSATNCGPTVSANPTYENTTHAALVGADTIIQGKSSFKIISPAITTRGSASVVKYYFKVGNGNYESATVNNKTYSSTSLSGNIIAYCYAEDSRGYTSAVKQVTMRVLAYSTPTATITATRNGYTTSGQITVSATRSTLSKSSATSTDVNSWQGNTSSSRVSLAISPTDATLAASTIGSAGSFTNQSVSISNLNLEKSYTITVNISDKISTVTKTISIEKATPILAILNTNRVGINKPDPGYTLDVNGDTNIGSNLYAGSYVVGKMRNRPVASIGSDDAESNGWYKVASSTMSGYGNTDMTLLVQDNYLQNAKGILNINMRSNNTNIGCWSLTWLSRDKGISPGDAIIVINGMSWTLYFYRRQSRYGRMGFHLLSHTNINGKEPQYNVSFYLNNLTKETTTPTATATATDTVTDIIYPVGSIYLSINNVNPSTYFGGTWEAFGQGRTLIGAGTGTDSRSESKTFTGGATGGEYNTKLETTHLPAHTHGSRSITGTAHRMLWDDGEAITVSGALGKGNSRQRTWSGAGGNTACYELTLNATHTHDSVGDGTAHNNMQPYIVTYMWKRTA